MQGQRLMQEASDIFLGWTHGEVDLYVRQLRDMKVSAEIATLTKKQFDLYTRLCAIGACASPCPQRRPGDDQRLPGNSDAFAQAIAVSPRPMRIRPSAITPRYSLPSRKVAFRLRSMCKGDKHGDAR